MESDEPQHLDAAPKIKTLTGPGDRALFLQGIGDVLAELAEGRAFVVMALGLDNFNDLTVARGEATAELVLREVVPRLREQLSSVHLIIWTSGDLFVLACELADSPRSLNALQVSVISCFDEPFLATSAPVYLSASLGVASATGPRDDAQELLGSAEVACSEARRAGGRRIIAFDRPARTNVGERFEMTQALHRAVEQHELSLEYQPILNLASMATVGLEALLRWNPRGRGQVRPDTFIPLAEGSGLIVPIGSWVLGEVVEQWAHWAPVNSGLVPPWVTVNVSLAQLDVGFASLAEDLLAAESALSGRLSVEITESRLTIDPEGARATLNWLRRLGIKVILDDFGTGYSSLLSLRSFPVDALKIDRSFVEHLLESDRDQAIVGTIIDLAHTLDILVIAEGVESAAELECLAALSCDQAQGFYISPPAPLDEVRAAFETAAPLVQRSMDRD